MAKRADIFQKVQLAAPSANVFDLSHDVKMSMKMGRIVPTCLIDCVPGDHFKINVENLLRFSPLVAPIMHEISRIH